MRRVNRFAAAVERLRRERGLSLGEVAARTSYSASYLSKLIHGRRSLLPIVVREIDKALRADGELERLAADQRQENTATIRPMPLPPGPADFVGREDSLRALNEAFGVGDRPEAPRMVVVEGGFWVGKTALVLHWANRVQARFPGGCLFADLRGLSAPADPGAILDGFLRMLGADGDDLLGSVDEKAARFRSLLAVRPALVILDNIAGYDQVRPLLPGGNSAVVATSREHQTGLLLHSGATHLDLGPLATGEALNLLRHRLGEARVKADPRAAEAVVRRCGHLPMAILVAADHVQQHPDQSLSRVAEKLKSDRRRLDLFTSSDPAVNVHGLIDLSYLALPKQAQRVCRLLGISPAVTVTAESVGALVELDVDQAAEILDLLRRVHLVEDVAPGRVRQNHLLRAYASQRAVVEEPLSEVERAHDRVLRWYAATARAANAALAPHWSRTQLPPVDTSGVLPREFAADGYDEALEWCRTEVDTALHVAHHARSHEIGDIGWLIPAMFVPFFYLTQSWSLWLTAAHDGLAAARTCGNQDGTARSLHSLGLVLHELGRDEEAITLLTEARDLHSHLDQQAEHAWCNYALAAAQAALDHHDKARETYRYAKQGFAATDQELGAALTTSMLASCEQAVGNAEHATQCAHEGLRQAQQLQSRFARGVAHHQLGTVLLRQNRPRHALTHLDAARTLRRAGQETRGEAESLIRRGEALLALNLARQAQESYMDAAAILDNLHDPRIVEVQTRIATLTATLRPHNKHSTVA